MIPWWREHPLLGLDLETTGTDVNHDRIVTAALVGLGASGSVRSRVELLANPGIPITRQATAVHGITDADAADGDSPLTVLTILTTELVAFLRKGVPLAVFNAVFDLTILDRELRRCGLPPLFERTYPAPPAVLDPLILDWKADQKRTGSRRLTDQCDHYGVPCSSAHNAAADAEAAARLARELPEAHPGLRRDLSVLHTLQTQWAAERALALQRYLRAKHENTAITCPTDWPLVPAREEAAA